MPCKTAPFSKTGNAVHKQAKKNPGPGSRVELLQTKSQLPCGSRFPNSHVHPRAHCGSVERHFPAFLRVSLKAGLLGKAVEGAPSTCSFSTSGSPSCHSRPKQVPHLSEAAPTSLRRPPCSAMNFSLHRPYISDITLHIFA